MSTPLFPILSLLLVLLPLSAAATLPGSRWQIERYTVADGLPGDSLNQLVEDATGQLWIAGGQGLARYDGRVIEVHDRRRLPLLGSDEVRSLLPEPDGGLLIGMAAC
jgi:ligand-binding sensor domain-containing protein